MNATIATLQKPVADTCEPLVKKEEVAKFIVGSMRTVERDMKKGLPFYRLNRRKVRFKLSEVSDYYTRKCRIVQVVREK